MRENNKDRTKIGKISNGVKYTLQEEELIERINWYIRVRWITILGVFVVVLFVSRALKMPLHTASLYAVTFIIAGYNLLFLLYAKKLVRGERPGEVLKRANRFANIQISFDLVSLTALIHFSGGIENPFFFYYIFHMIVASMLLSRRASYLQATLAIFLLGGLIGLEYFRLIPHVYLEGFVKSDLSQDKVYILSILFVFATTLYISVSMATSISKKLRQRQRELAEANEKLIKQDRLKSEYVSYVLRVSHDIQEDLSSIQGCLKVISAGFVGVVNEKQSELIRRAEYRTSTLLHFVRDVLGLSRLKSVRLLEGEITSLPEAIQAALDSMSIRPEDRNIKIELDLPSELLKVRISETHLKELIVNLVANATKYTPEKGEIQIRAKEQESDILVEIQDTGIGVLPDDRDKIFTEFYRAANAKAVERDGTGLGLPIAKQIVQNYGGRIWVESEGEGKGSKFYFTLPKVSS